MSVIGATLAAEAATCRDNAWPQTRPLTAPPVRPYVRLDAFYPDRAEMPLGVGHIRPTADDLLGWHERVRLPLYATPNGEIAGFIDGGWLQGRGADPVSWVALGTEGLVETAYETPSFMVLERREDGWMRVIVKQPSDYCASEDIVVETREGWVKWRSPEKGPWVWYYTRGC